ncbi:hypothetical protein VKT23_011056 [Stygiomarasmius scandens]|uniref:Uncharacterized protein n=1 Tax=Marasmiellus scandens TaxID=2682957 RepID=A0ABR1JAC4_9AGAR
MALTAAVEAICSSIVLFWIFRFHMNTRHLQRASRADSIQSHIVIGTSSTGFLSGRNISKKYRGVIIHIVLYPIVSLLMYPANVALDIYSVISSGTTTNSNFQMSVVNLTLYSLRIFLYAVLALKDPSFRRAIRGIKGKEKRTTNGLGGTVSEIHFASGEHGPVNSSVTSADGINNTVELELIRRPNHIEAEKDVPTSSDSTTPALSQGKPQTSSSTLGDSPKTEAKKRSHFKMELGYEEDREFKQL